jgi:hypothetical protein
MARLRAIVDSHPRNAAAGSFPTVPQPVIHNPAMTSWLTLHGMKATFFDLSEKTRTEHGHEFLPLLDTSAALQYRFFGDNPVPYHLVQILLFSAATLLLFEFFRAIGLTFGAAAVSALHQGMNGMMVALQPPHIRYVPIAEAIEKMKLVPPDGEGVQTARALDICLGD